MQLCGCRLKCFRYVLLLSGHWSVRSQCYHAPTPMLQLKVALGPTLAPVAIATLAPQGHIAMLRPQPQGAGWPGWANVATQSTTLVWWEPGTPWVHSSPCPICPWYALCYPCTVCWPVQGPQHTLGGCWVGPTHQVVLGGAGSLL